MAIIYVSSTFKDLKECRDQVIQLLRRMRHEVVTMEDYTAEEQWHGDALSNLGVFKNLDPFFEFLKKEVATAAKNTGSNWPHCDWFVEWLRGYTRVPFKLTELFGSIVGSAGSRTDAVHRTILDYIANCDWTIRHFMILALSTGWKYSEQTAELLRKLTVVDSDSIVRSAALTALATNYRDAEGTRELLRDRAVNDPDPTPEAEDYYWWDYVRKTAIEAIARHWPDQPDTLMLLRERAENDPTEWLRKRAKELADGIEASS